VRWFTRQWLEGELPDPEADKRQLAYTAHLDSICDRLPAAVVTLVRPRHPHASISDALVDRIVIDEGARRISMRLLNGELQVGYGKLDIEFQDAELVEPGVDRLRELLAAARTEFVRSEVELSGAGERLEIRFLLWPQGEIGIQCAGLTTAWHPIADDTRTDYGNEVVYVCS
jgi:hypothetical protein